MKLHELNFKDGKKYRADGKIYIVAGNDLINIDTNNNIINEFSMKEVINLDFEEVPAYKNPYERVADEEKYYYINNDSVYLHDTKECNHKIDKYRYSVANYFNNEEYAGYIAFKEALLRNMDKFALENNDVKLDWDNNEQPKYYIEYLYDLTRLKIAYAYQRRQGESIYFSSEEIAEKAIEKFEDDLLSLYSFKF